LATNSQSVFERLSPLLTLSSRNNPNQTSNLNTMMLPAPLSTTDNHIPAAYYGNQTPSSFWDSGASESRSTDAATDLIDENDDMPLPRNSETLPLAHFWNDNNTHRFSATLARQPFGNMSMAFAYGDVDPESQLLDPEDCEHGLDRSEDDPIVQGIKDFVEDRKGTFTRNIDFVQRETEEWTRNLGKQLSVVFGVGV
jgi:hypothetical protein